VESIEDEEVNYEGGDIGEDGLDGEDLKEGDLKREGLESGAKQPNIFSGQFEIINQSINDLEDSQSKISIDYEAI
jgi:hypothetical protein